MRVLIIAFLAALALPGAASAAGSFQIGTGAHPDVAVDSNGTAHVVWDEKTSDVTDPDSLAYCRIPRGASACDVKVVLHPPLEAIGRSSYVFAPSPGRVLVETYRCCGEAEGNYVYESTDGGQTFGPQRLIGKIDHQSDAILGPGEAISGASISTFQTMPLAGPPPPSHAEFDAGFPIPTQSDVGLFGGTKPVQVMSDTDHTSFVTATGSDLNQSASWSAAQPLTPPGGDPRLAGGPAGLVLLYSVGEGSRTLVARKFDGSAFGPAAKVSETGDPIFFDLSAQPSTGEFHAFWNANGVSPNELRWARSKDGATWSKPQTIVAGDEADSAFNLQVAAAPDEGGFAVWDGNSSTGQVRGAPLVPSASSGGGDGTDGSATAPADSTTVAGQELTLLTPGACVNPGVKVALRVTSKIKHLLSPKKRVKIVHVDFFLDKKHARDRKAAFKAFFKTKGLKAPSTHKLKAKVLLKPVVGKGKKKTKTLKGKLKICG